MCLMSLSLVVSTICFFAPSFSALVYKPKRDDKYLRKFNEKADLVQFSIDYKCGLFFLFVRESSKFSHMPLECLCRLQLTPCERLHIYTNMNVADICRKEARGSFQEEDCTLSLSNTLLFSLLTLFTWSFTSAVFL